MQRHDWFFVGVTVGMVLSLVVLFPSLRMDFKRSQEHSQMITDCEKNKPRSIHCILTAVEKPQ